MLKNNDNYCADLLVTTSSYLSPKKINYWIYTVIPELFENLDNLRPFVTLLENFGTSVGERAQVFLPYRGTYAANRQIVLSLQWNEQIKASLIQKRNPYLLVVPCEISQFIPSLTEYVIIDFPHPTTNLEQHFHIIFDLSLEILAKAHISDWKYIIADKTAQDDLVSRVIDTGGGTVIDGDVSVIGGDVIGRDKIITEINIYMNWGRYEQYQTTRNWKKQGKPSLSKFDLSNRDLSGSFLRKANLSGADLTGANLSYANLYGADLRGANLGKADLTNASLHRANLTKTDLSEGKLFNTDLRAASLHGTRISDVVGLNAKWKLVWEILNDPKEKRDLRGGDLSCANLEGANLYDADLSNANLYDADLSNANLYDADLSNANLTRVDLCGTNLSGTNLSKTDLSRSRYNYRTQWPEGFTPPDVAINTEKF